MKKKVQFTPTPTFCSCLVLDSFFWSVPTSKQPILFSRIAPVPTELIFIFHQWSDRKCVCVFNPDLVMCVLTLSLRLADLCELCVCEVGDASSGLLHLRQGHRPYRRHHHRTGQDRTGYSSTLSLHLYLSLPPFLYLFLTLSLCLSIPPSFYLCFFFFLSHLLLS